jgi:uncharacterized delta-60 repeat protein
MRKIALIATVLILLQISLVALVLVQQGTWGGPDEDKAAGVAVAADGSVYVTGTTLSFGQGARDAFLLKYASDGSLVWQRTYGTAPSPTSSANEFGNAVAVAPDGSAVYITGQFGDGNPFLVKFSSGGTLIWQETFGNGAFSSGVAVANDGNVYVAGGSFNEGVGQGDALLVKFTPAGAIVWAKTWGGPNFDAARGIAIGTDGGIYIAGETNSFSANDAFLVKFNPDGTVAWDRDWGTTNGVQSGQTAAFGVGTGPDGGVYITGNEFDIGAKKNIILVKFDASGNQLWEKIGGPGFGAGLGVAANADFVYVTGNIVVDTPGATGGNAFVARYFPNGKAKDANAWGGNDDESGEAIAVAPDGSVVAAGFAGAPPYSFAHAAKTVKAPSSVLITPTGSVLNATGTIAAAAGIVGTPTGSQTFAGGGTDAMLIRVRP